jgi:hypothetical protein
VAPNTTKALTLQSLAEYLLQKRRGSQNIFCIEPVNRLLVFQNAANFLHFAITTSRSLQKF